MNRATSFAERLRLNLAVIHGEVKQDDNEDDGRNSPPPQEMEGEGLSMPPIARTPSKSGIPVFYYRLHDLEAVGCCQFLYQSGLILFVATVVPKEKPPINVVGDVHGRIAIIIVRTSHVTYPCGHVTFSSPQRMI